MKNFKTHIVISNSEAFRICDEFKGNTWYFTAIDEPTYRYWEKKDFSGSWTIYKNENKKWKKNPPPNAIRKKEIVLSVPNENNAKNLVSLILGGKLLLYPQIHAFQIPTVPLEYPEDFDEDLFLKAPIKNYFICYDSMYLAFKIASRAINDIKAIFAIEKFKASLELASCTIESMHPKFGNIFNKQYYDYEYYTKAAFAINAAFSAIEELGLEIRSSSKKKRFISDLGEWNSDVLKDIELRLSEIGINNSEKIQWLIRGSKNDLENSLQPTFGIKSDWCDYLNVEDIDLSFPEALHYCSYLRNFHTAHKFKDLDSGLGPYLVFNVQNVARRIILSYLKIWYELKE